MPEILTESFCERCGTRYTFESVAPRKTRRLGQFKTLSKGVRNWVMSDDSSLDEALAAARSDEEREVTAQQLDAFHATFNFCMNCRQYTCANCWNPVEGRCLTCAPNLSGEVLQAPFPSAAGFEPIGMDAGAWPEIDLAGGAPIGAAGLDVAGMPAEAGGNGFHVHDDVFESSNGPTEEPLPDVDATARLAFLAGDTDQETAAAPSMNGTDADAAPSLAWPDDTALETELAATPDVEAAGAAEPEGDITLESGAAEPEADVTLESGAAEPEGAAAPEDAEVALAEPVESGAGPVEPVVDSLVAEPGPEDTDHRAAELASRTSALLGRFRPGQNLDAEIAAYEARLEAEEALAVEPAPAAEPEIAVAEPETVEAIKPVTEVEAPARAAEEIAATAETEPTTVPWAPELAPTPAAQPVEEPAGAEPGAEPVAATSEPAPEAPPTRDDVVEQPTWRIFAPDPASVQQPGVPGAGVPAGTPVQASADPQWPARPELEDSPSMALFANRDRVSSDALWAASAREVLGGPVGPTPAPTAGIQPCSNCGLSLSANARFCRRCGTRQG